MSERLPKPPEGNKISGMNTLEVHPAHQQSGDLLTAIGETLRAERTEKGLTLKQVAEGAHVSVSYLAEIERGEKDPSSRVLESVARGLDVETSYLLLRVANALETTSVVPVSSGPLVAA